LAELSDPAVAELGAALYAARRTGVPIEPLTDAHAAMSVTDAYRVQRDLVARLLADGDRVAGYKLGLTSAPMQRMFGVDSPDFAPVLASHLHPDGAEVPRLPLFIPGWRQKSPSCSARTWPDPTATRSTRRGQSPVRRRRSRS